MMLQDRVTIRDVNTCSTKIGMPLVNLLIGGISNFCTIVLRQTLLASIHEMSIKRTIKINVKVRYVVIKTRSNA